MIRIRTIYIVFILVYISIIARLFYWQVISGENLKAQAAIQYEKVILLPASRGSILASGGNPLVVNQPAYLLYALPNEIRDKIHFLDALSSVLPIDRDALNTALDTPGRMWISIAKKIDINKKNEVLNLKLTGLGYEKESKRYYSEASMAAHLLGFVGQDADGSDKGYFGLEGYYDRILRGKNGKQELESDPNGRRILLDDNVRLEPENGRTLELWLDKTIQLTVERHLKEGIAKYGAREGSVVVMDPQSGGILAMASYPSYDPQQYSMYAEEYFKNPVVAGSYEPGSTYKVLIMAKAIEEDVVDPGTLLNEDGPVSIAGYSIQTWNNEYHGSITATQVLTYSSNVGMVRIGEKVGKDKLLDVTSQLGFGNLTDIDLQDEESPELRDLQQWRDIDVATLTFGQGIAVTPIQMVRAVATLANGGWLLEPKVVKRIIDENGNAVDVKSKRLRQVFKPATARLLTEMMVSAVDNGEAKWAKPKGYRIAGKTGTAQIPVEGHYDEKKTIASFVGFAPAESPRFVILVTLREPTSSPWGSETAAPLFFSIARDLFLYLAIPQS